MSPQAAHEAMLEYGSTDLQALVQITGEGGAWSNPALVALLTEQPTDADECQQLYFLVFTLTAAACTRLRHTPDSLYQMFVRPEINSLWRC